MIEIIKPFEMMIGLVLMVIGCLYMYIGYKPFKQAIINEYNGYKTELNNLISQANKILTKKRYWK